MIWIFLKGNLEQTFQIQDAKNFAANKYDYIRADFQQYSLAANYGV